MRAYDALADIFRKKGPLRRSDQDLPGCNQAGPKKSRRHGLAWRMPVGDRRHKNAIISYEQVVLMKPKPTKEYKLLGDLQMKAGKDDAGMDRPIKKYLAETPQTRPSQKPSVFTCTKEKLQGSDRLSGNCQGRPAAERRLPCRARRLLLPERRGQADDRHPFANLGGETSAGNAGQCA